MKTKAEIEKSQAESKVKKARNSLHQKQAVAAGRPKKAQIVPGGTEVLLKAISNSNRIDECMEAIVGTKKLKTKI